MINNLETFPPNRNNRNSEYLREIQVSVPHCSMNFEPGEIVRKFLTSVQQIIHFPIHS